VTGELYRPGGDAEPVTVAVIVTPRSSLVSPVQSTEAVQPLSRVLRRVPLQFLNGVEPARDRRHQAVGVVGVECEGVDVAVLLERDAEEAAVDVLRVVGGVVYLARRLVGEAGAGELRVGHERDALGWHVLRR
jgi:hypothetical protein